MKTKVFWFDVETTGLSPIKNDTIQLAYIVDIDGKVETKGEFFIQPFDYNNISMDALKVNGLTIDKLKTFTIPQTIYTKLQLVLSKFVDKYNSNDKFIPAGFNVQFDIGFLQQFFLKNMDKYYGSFFDYKAIDVALLAYMLVYFGKLRLEDYKLVTLAHHYGIKLNAHNALSDIEATRELFLILSNEIRK